MLITAVQQTSDSVVVDLLTFADLEELKSRRAASSSASAAQKPAVPPAQPAQSGLQPSNKRYLILTYAAEFDRVHYPLPLAYEDRPDPDRLKGLIRQLRLQLTEVVILTCHLPSRLNCFWPIAEQQAFIPLSPCWPEALQSIHELLKSGTATSRSPFAGQQVAVISSIRQKHCHAQGIF